MHGKRAPRLAFYSHDTMGLGHIRRNMLLANAVLKTAPQTEVLLINGVREAGSFYLPKGADIVTLPTYLKNADGNYLPRSLGNDVKRLTALRSGIIYAAIENFAPDIVIIDNVPNGAMSELEQVLPMLAANQVETVLGLRDIIDEPEAVKRQWEKLNNFATVRDYFTAVWVYGDPAFYNLFDACEFGKNIRQKTTFIGYLDARLRPRKALKPEEIIPGIHQPYTLCVVGGGQDGYQLAATFASATFPEDTMGVLITGSMMAPTEYNALKALAHSRKDLLIARFVAEPLELLRQAQSVVAMGGYNTVTEILSFHKRALIVPRVTPRQEQWIRASLLAERQLIACIHPAQLTVPLLNQWLKSASPPPDPRDVLNFGGLDSFVRNIKHLFSQRGITINYPTGN